MDVINQHLGGDERVKAADQTTALLINALDAGYLYGLAVGLAMGKGGAR
jgi:hypothetical protein